MTSYDVAVLGLGAMGAAAAWRAAARGASVIGFEQFTPAHARGSSHGGSRIFRRTVFEGIDYVPVVRRAEQLWAQLERDTGATVFHRSGGLCVGAAEGELVRDAMRCAEEGDVEIELLDADALAGRYPQFAVAPGDVGVFEPGAGVLDPEGCIRAELGLAKAAGAELRFETQVSGLQYDDAGVRISVGAETITARRAIVATGAWFTDLVPELALPLRVQRSPLVWFAGADQAAYGPDRFPTFIWESGDLDGWGIPDVDGRGVKVGAGRSAAKPWLEHASDNDYPIGPADTGPVEAIVRRAFPGLDPVPVAATPCMNSKSPDGDFVIGIPAAAPALVLAGAFSGHGFKHSAAVGDITVDLAVDGASDIALGHFSPDRFGPTA
ncbi:sarcosine oxidase [Kribbella aluminosa]|uniref:Sarcosine oxidase n=1 Tax=Kribbella aluminosa TaxID=416017 RepID=A0ABS4UG62_9ACTN|nr:N-methyl-L-tryptophan oxidase [Kribbella aluminosa]MBP2350546.1 sarcosine oxidase [Kribbella aluminosa]